MHKDTLTAHAGKEFLSFTLGGLEYGLDFGKVQELRVLKSLERFADGGEIISGVALSRGVIMPIVDMRAAFCGHPVATTPMTDVIILKLSTCVMGMVVDGVIGVVTLQPEQISPIPGTDGRAIEGSHVMMSIGSIPNTADLNLEAAGVEVTPSGHIHVDRVSRTNVAGIYAAGDCTGKLALASVAAMQGRIAVAHLLGDALKPLRPHLLASNIFTSPEIATVGVTQAQVDSGQYQADVLRLDFHTNPRAKMSGAEEGFVKIFARQGSGTVIGGVVVSPRASELIYALALAVTHKLHVDDLADTFTVYPSMSGSIAEAARRLHVHL